MSKDKNRSEQRRLALLTRMMVGPIGVNRRWCMRLSDKTLQDIIKRGLGIVTRSTHGNARREVKRKGCFTTHVEITDKGREEFLKHEQSNRFDEMAHRVAAIQARRVRTEPATSE